MRRPVTCQGRNRLAPGEILCHEVSSESMGGRRKPAHILPQSQLTYAVNGGSGHQLSILERVPTIQVPPVWTVTIPLADRHMYGQFHPVSLRLKVAEDWRVCPVCKDAQLPSNHPLFGQVDLPDPLNPPNPTAVLIIPVARQPIARE